MEEYSLPKLEYGYDDLEPHISAKLLELHHKKHHQAYIDGANSILEMMKKARVDGGRVDMKAALKSLSYNIGGHLLHSIYWKSMSPEGGNEPDGKLGEMIEEEFSSFERFKKELTSAAMTAEGAGWGVLALCPKSGRPIIMQIEKHNTNIIPSAIVLFAVDAFEHAFYLDYENRKGEYLEAFWKIADWREAEKRLKESGFTGR